VIRLALSRRAVLGAFAVACIASSVSAQVVQQSVPADPLRKKALSTDEYSRWRQIEGSQISSDGRHVAYVLRQTNVPQAESKPVLHIVRLDDNQDVTVANASQPTFSPDGRWVTYQIEPPPRANGRGRGAAADTATPDSAGRGRAGAPPQEQRRMELRELATGRVQSWQNMASATFSPTSSHVLFRRTAGAGAAGGGRGGAPGAPPPGAPGATPPAGSGVQTATPRGSDAILHNLATGRYVFIGSVGDAAFNRKGEMLAYTVDAAVRDGNGVFAIELATGRTLPLDNDARAYNRMTWNDAGNAVAVLKGVETPRMRERANAVTVIANVRAGFDDPSALMSTTLDATTAAGFPRGFVISDRAPLSWSDDDNRVFFGIIPQTPAPDTARRRSADSVADVDVWRTMDERIQSLQMIRADADRNFTFRQAFDVSAKKFVALADSSMRDIEIAPDGKWAVGRDARAYVSDYERPRADFYRVNTSTGERTLMLKGQLTSSATFGISPDGRHFLYWANERYQDYDLDAAKSVTIGAGAPSFVDTEYDHPGPRPPFGPPIYTADGKGVVVQHRFDLWLLPLDPSAPARVLTSGMGNRGQVEFRIIRTEPADPMAPRAVRENARTVDLSKPVTLSAYGDRTKKAGFYELSGNTMKEIVYDDASYNTPVKAAKVDRFLLTRQTFAEFPDLRVSGPAFGGSRKISDANPQQSEYLWGHRVLFDYKIKDGRTLQGILAVPNDYKAGEKRPMIVSFYEKNSQNMHRYSAPNFVTGMGALPMEAVTKGYLTMLADVHFHTGSSHSDMREAVEAATKKVIEMGYADPKKIAVHGHSYGGEGAAFIATRSKMFAAVGVGAGVSDLYSDFMQPWGWTYQVNSGSGANAFDYYIYGQGRWGFTPWEKPDVYRYESAITHAPATSQPVLIMHGTADPTVSFMEGLNFYEALRYNKKDAYLLAYPGEGHGLRGLANRRDLTVRYFEFFDHYLKGAPAPKWMTDGVPFLVKEAKMNASPAQARPIVP
jgi:dipeptidyl aminopeptidase/acylaminoacyl peptidase